MKLKIGLIVALTISFVCLGTSMWLLYSTPKIVCINNVQLFKDYKGSIISRKEMDSKIESYQSNIDTLVHDFQREVDAVKSGKVSPAVLIQRKEYLKKREQELMNYKYALQDKIKEEEAKYNLQIINQVNSLLTEFGEKQGYDYILGITENGSLLYARDKKDVTKEALNYLNQKYDGK